jgi:hypothetical protein
VGKEACPSDPPAMLATQCVTICVTMWLPQTGRAGTVSDVELPG